VELESVCSIPVQEFLVTRLAFTLDGRYVLIGHRHLALYEILSGRAVRTFPFDAFVASLGFSTDGRYLAAVNEDDHLPRTRGLARVFDLATGAVVWETEPPRPVEAGCFLESPDGLVFLCNTPSAAGSSRLSGCRLPSGEPAPGLDLPGWSIREMAARGGALTLFGREQVAQICEIEGAALALYPFKIGTYSYPQGAPGLLRRIASGAGLSSLSPRGQMLALEVIDAHAREHHLSLVALDSNAEARLALAPDTLPAFAFSHDGAQFACLNQDSDSAGGLLRIWDTRTLEPLGRTAFPCHYHKIALHWPTRRLAALGAGRCDILLIHD
jgi:WD40 repeat protein